MFYSSSPRVEQHDQSHFVMTGVTKPIFRKYVHLDSRNAIIRDGTLEPASSNGVFQFALPTPIHDVHSIQLVSIEHPFYHTSFTDTILSSEFGNNIMCITAENSDGSVLEKQIVRFDTLYAQANVTMDDICTTLNDQLTNPFHASTFAFSVVDVYSNSNGSNCQPPHLHQRIELTIQSPTDPEEIVVDHFRISFLHPTSNDPFQSSFGWTFGFRQTEYVVSGTGEVVIIAEAHWDVKAWKRFVYVMLNENGGGANSNHRKETHVVPLATSSMPNSSSTLAKLILSDACNSAVSDNNNNNNNNKSISAIFNPCTIANAQNGLLIGETRREYNARNHVQFQNCQIWFQDVFGRNATPWLLDGTDFSCTLCIETSE